MQEFITNNFEETRALGKALAQEIRAGAVLCLHGDLGAGKTTFTQGLLEGMGATGPYTSPTFIVMKHYPIEKLQSPIRNVFHIDTYRVEEQDILGLGWEEMIADEKNLLIVEWPERIAKIIPKNSTWINFEWLSENERKITFETK